MKRFLLIALSAALLAQPGQASAQLYYNGIPDATEYLNFMSGSGFSGGYGVQVGPYTGQFVGGNDGAGSSPFSLYCVDYLHYAKDGNVNVTLLNSVGANGPTRLDDYTRYRKLAYLASLFDTAPKTQTSWGGIQAAIWKIASGVTLGTGATATYRDQLLAAAVPTSFSTDGWYILTPTNAAESSSGQEFLMRTRVSVPEPAGFLLMATGLLMLAAVSRKRITEMRERDA
ncbi:MAG: PEP-CTERM sorting domain-containing protein [Gemmatimonadetes bacterium]|nr:PEP-CTERM sorting domain-containing protein [Gemmatimonadota bacterium]